MPEYTLDLPPDVMAELERVRAARNLPDVNAAATWLMKNRIDRTKRLSFPPQRVRRLFVVRQEGERRKVDAS